MKKLVLGFCAVMMFAGSASADVHSRQVFRCHDGGEPGLMVQFGIEDQGANTPVAVGLKTWVELPDGTRAYMNEYTDLQFEFVVKIKGLYKVNGTILQRLDLDLEFDQSYKAWPILKGKMISRAAMTQDRVSDLTCVYTGSVLD